MDKKLCQDKSSFKLKSQNICCINYEKHQERISIKL